PPPTPPEEGSQCQGTLAEFPSWEGPGVGRLMERSHGFPTAPRGHEPPPHLTSGHPPHQLGGTSDIEHPTPNIEWQRDPSLTSAFAVSSDSTLPPPKATNAIREDTRVFCSTRRRTSNTIPSAPLV